MSDKLFNALLRYALPTSLIAWLIMVLLALFFTAKAQADETVPATEWVYQTAAAADMLTTLDIKNHPDRKEANPLLGAHPSDAKVVVYFAGTAMVHYLLTRELVRAHVSSKLVQTWEALGIGIEVGVVAHNYSLGVRMKF